MALPDSNSAPSYDTFNQTKAPHKSHIPLASFFSDIKITKSRYNSIKSFLNYMFKSAVCLVVRDEAQDILEWVAFHSAVGFDTQIIFDNCSTDETPRLLQAISKIVDVRVIPWQNRGALYQENAYLTAASIFRKEFEWMAFIDSDEFFIPELPVSLEKYLQAFPNAGGIAVNWALYGSNNHQQSPDGFIIKNFTRRSESSFFPNRHIKSLVRPESIVSAGNPHFFNLDAPYFTASGAPLEWFKNEHGVMLKGVSASEPDYKGARINHYFTKSFEHWKKKVKRGYNSAANSRKIEEFSIYDQNQIEDLIAFRYLAKTQEIFDSFKNLI
ncbi:glycosyltransferase family 92 protein [Granulibacter bethesdensis]|nr:glycosyltransferase family 92 protein [Granulibacter bethesdensis]